MAEQPQAVPAREALIVRTLINHPWLIEDHCEAISELPLASAPVAGVRDALLDLLAAGIPLDSSQLRAHLSARGLDTAIALAERAIAHRSDKFAEPGADPADVEAGWRHAVALQTQAGLKQALLAAERAWSLEPGEDTWSAIVELQRRLARGAETEGAGGG